MLRVNDVSKIRGNFNLHGISFELPPGYICGLIGENGAGKTTLIKIICGLYSRESGTVSIDGSDIDTDLCEARNKTGTVFCSNLFDERMTLKRNGSRFGKLYRNYSDSRLDEYMSRFGLDSRKKFGRISKGEKLKFSLAFALSYAPKLLVLDEPAANFDPEFRNEFNTVLREFTSDGTRSVLLSTHIMSDAEKYSDYLLMLRKEEQVLFGDIETIRSGYRMAAGEERVLRTMKDSIIGFEKDSLGCRALVRKSRKEFHPSLQIWEPGIEELLYFFSKEGNTRW